MDSNLTPSKRPFESPSPSLDPHSFSKSQKTDPNSSPTARLITYKVLCPLSQSGSVIGKGGDIVSKIRAQTGAKIKLQDAVRGCDERIVVITSYCNYKSAQKDEENYGNDTERNNEEREREREETPAYRALMRVFERVVNLTYDINGEEEEERENEERESEDNSTIVSFRMLVLSSQVGSILGKGGVVIKRIMAESGAQIRILSRDLLPFCANTYEDVLQINGGKSQVRTALKSIAEILLDRPIQTRDSSSSSFKPPAVSQQQPHHHFQPRQFGSGPPRLPPGPLPGPPGETMTYRLLCNNDKVGGVIGKAGHVVKNIKNETGTDVVISELVPGSESDERMIALSGPVFYDDGFSPVQTAVMRVLQRLIHGGAQPVENRNGECRLVVSTNQIGCLLGKGGGIISEMRKTTKAFIRIMKKEEKAEGLEENSEVIQVSGIAESVEEAMVQITTRLKHHFMRDKMPPPPFGHPPFGGEMEPPFGGGGGPRYFSGMPPPQPYPAPPPHHPLLPYDDSRYPPWGPPGIREPMPDYHGGPPVRGGGFPVEENVAAVVNPINLEIVIPRSLIPNLIGEDGEGCLKQIRETSEAKITITEPRPESTETVIMIYGVPEQAYCAKSLLQAFILSETEGAREV
ncbi:hypothetical protein LUZ60_009982 [Juncus effusus]|nr:hypothetical protein LUZ60_009982 [Juncus effusus]